MSDDPQARDASDLGERLAARAPRLRLLLLHLSGRAVRARVDVEDLVQETFLRALADSAQVPGPGAGEAALDRWLARVARHCVVDVARALRAAKRDGAVRSIGRSDWSRAGLAESRIAARGPGVSTLACAAEDSQRLARAFAALSAEHRRVIGLRQLEGCSAAETARRMGRSETAVHSLYRRALIAWEDATRASR
ncbi:MAG: RNA polymerase sigma factor [Planctomycetota bacterium]